MWGGTALYSAGSPARLISIHPPRVGWDPRSPRAGGIRSAISIHPPRVGWDYVPSPSSHLSAHFNPPTPCGVGLEALHAVDDAQQFQSTHPVWGGTPSGPSLFLSRMNFNPPTPCGVGPLSASRVSCVGLISIHPPRVGWDARAFGISVAKNDFNPPTPCGVGHPSALRRATPSGFQSTHPVWGGTAGRQYSTTAL